MENLIKLVDIVCARYGLVDWNALALLDDLELLKPYNTPEQIIPALTAFSNHRRSLAWSPEPDPYGDGAKHYRWSLARFRMKRENATKGPTHV